MARRVPPNDKPYRPVDEALVRSVLNPEPNQNTAKVLQTPEPFRPPPRLVGLEGRKEAQWPPLEPSTTPGVEKLTREKRVLLTPTEEWELERLISEMAGQLRTPLKPSHVFRATVMLLRHASEELLKQSRRVGPLKRPPNNDVMALAAFEHYLAQVIDSALRNTKPFS